MRRLTVTMNQQERQALEELARQNLRQPREHMRYLLREEALRRGLLPEESREGAAREVCHAEAH